MQYQTLGSETFSLVTISLDRGDRVQITSGTMVYHNDGVELASGLFGFTTGEGLVNRFTGCGRVYIQMRNIEALANLVSPYIATKTRTVNATGDN